jgi:hypothetical protein
MKTIKVIGKLAFVILIFGLTVSNILNWGPEIFADGATLVFILAGGVGLMLMGFSLPEIVAAFKHAFGNTEGADGEQLKLSAYFWESTARSLLALGALGAVIGYSITLRYNAGIRDFGLGGATAFLTTIYGLTLAALCAIPALVLRKKINDQTLPAAERPAVSGREKITGYILFFAALMWTVSGKYDVFLNLSSLLVVAGLASALLVLLGDMAAGYPVTLSFAVTGLIGGLIGIARFFIGIYSVAIQEIARGITFSLLSSFFALLGMLLAGKPMEDWAFRTGKNGREALLSRFAWYGFPFLVLALILFCQLIIMIPMQKD